jgi:hypothetical protein
VFFELVLPFGDDSGNLYMIRNDSGFLQIASLFEATE